MKIRIKAKTKSSQRTKNRIKERGPDFDLIKKERPICFDGRECFMLKSKSWQGWIPSDEIEIV
tara:strand:- start:6432 stop:6620 length:189 start_codon:yes stop_codon:yes gene_type:complete